MTGTTTKREVADVNGYATRFFDWQEICDFYRAHYAGKTDFPGYAGSITNRFRPGVRDAWSGATPDEIIDRLENGYDLPPMPMDGAPAALESTRPRWRWSDNPDGEYQHDAFLNGEADYYLSRDRQGPKPGVNIEVHMSWAAMVNAETLAQYARFVGTAIAAIQAQGFDVALATVSRVKDLYPREPKSAIHVQVTRFGQTVLTHDFAALFSPGAYRHLIFSAKCQRYAEDGTQPKPGLGMTEKTDWNVTYDADTRTLTIQNNQQGRTFPEADMTAKLHKAIERF